MSEFVTGLIAMANAAAEHPSIGPTDLEARIARLEYERDVWRAKAAMHSKLAAPSPRFFVDTLTATGDTYLIPSTRRAEWQDFDILCEWSDDPGPVPEWAVKVAELSHVEFEQPMEIFAGPFQDATA